MRMKFPRIHPKRAGITIVDLTVLLAILVMTVLVAIKAEEYRQSRYRHRCYVSQSDADKLMWDVLLEYRKDVPQVAAGYILHEPGGQSKMVLIFLPDYGKNFPEEVVINLVEKEYTGRTVCPMHTSAPKDTPVIDLWYGAGRWRCLNNDLHN